MFTVVEQHYSTCSSSNPPLLFISPYSTWLESTWHIMLTSRCWPQAPKAKIEEKHTTFVSPCTNSDEKEKEKKKTRMAITKLFTLHANETNNLQALNSTSYIFPGYISFEILMNVVLKKFLLCSADDVFTLFRPFIQIILHFPNAS